MRAAAQLQRVTEYDAFSRRVLAAMRTIVTIAVLWLVACVLAGALGADILRRFGRSKTEEELARISRAARMIVQAQPLDDPVEEDPTWMKMLEELDVSIVSRFAKAPKSSAGQFAWERLPNGNYQVTTDIDCNAASIRGLQVTLLQKPDQTVTVWWAAWMALNLVCFAFVIMVVWWKRKEALAHRHLIDP